MHLHKPSWLSNKVQIKNSGIDGKGMVAVEPVKKGEKVLVFGGEYTDKS